MPLVSLEKITKIYNAGSVQVPALSDITVTIEKGEMVAIMGPSGSGKSTLMNVLGLLDRPTAGSYVLDGELISLSMSDKRLARIRSKKVGFVFQSFHLLSHLSALDNVTMPTIYSGVSRKEAKKRAEELLTTVGLKDRMHHRPNQLSGGEKQRVAIARSLINDPDVILADEPTGNLDTQTGTEVLRILKDLNKKGKTLIIITHDQFIADSCERIIHILDGRIVSEEDVQEPKAGTKAPWWKKVFNVMMGVLEEYSNV